jgi:hypothetical protein
MLGAMSHPLRRLIITVGAPELLNGKEGRYQLAAFYGELLGMRIINEGWLLIAEQPESKLVLALDGDGWSDLRPPRWRDPEQPQQLHLDLLVPDAEAAATRVAELGATHVDDGDGFQVFADPAGHPFCLYPDATAAAPKVGRLVFDCFSPRALATFYEGFLATHQRTLDTPERVEVGFGDDELPRLAFQHAQFTAARWPDPAYPAQLHVDYRWTDGLEQAALERAERLGAIRLPQLADTEIFADPASHPFCIQHSV